MWLRSVRMSTLALAFVLLVASSAAFPDDLFAQATLVPRVIQVDAMTCAELVALPREQQDRVLIYLNGYVNGMRRLTVWDERAEGAMIDRAIAACRSNPGHSALATFTRAATP